MLATVSTITHRQEKPDKKRAMSLQCLSAIVGSLDRLKDERVLSAVTMFFTITPYSLPSSFWYLWLIVVCLIGNKGSRQRRRRRYRGGSVVGRAVAEVLTRFRSTLICSLKRPEDL